MSPKRVVTDARWLSLACGVLFGLVALALFGGYRANKERIHENAEAIQHAEDVRRSVIIAGARSDLANCYDLRVSIIADARLDKQTTIGDARTSKRTLATTLTDLGLKATPEALARFRRQIDAQRDRTVRRLDARIDRYDPAKCLRLPLLRQATTRYGVTFTLKQAGW